MTAFHLKLIKEVCTNLKLGQNQMINKQINTTIFGLQLKKDVCSNFNIKPKLNDIPKNLI